MPVSASCHGRKPSSTSVAAPMTAQIASGRRNGRMMTPAVAATMMLQAQIASCGTLGTFSPCYEVGSFGSDSGCRRRCLPPRTRAAIGDLPRLGQGEEADDGADRGHRAEAD